MEVVSNKNIDLKRKVDPEEVRERKKEEIVKNLANNKIISKHHNNKYNINMKMK
jgi:hypothetical protein